MDSPPLIVVLGAGRSSRFGGDKIAATCAGLPLGQWTLEAALGTGLPVVWLAGDTAPAFVEGRCEVRHNLHAAEGIGTSVAMTAGLAAERGAAAVLIVLADMPLVNTALLERLTATGAPAACRHPDGHPGVPALLPASAFPALHGLTGDQGAGRILRSLTGLHVLECGPDELLDVDSAADLAEAERLLLAKFSTSGGGGGPQG
ncbi:MAG: nucleotidyltransferase family protein [Novosphingobium sp.]